jgi:uncharacterized C2H2 Zn-finger protein
MSENINTEKIFRCNICDKVYKSSNILWNRNNKFHNSCHKIIVTNINLLVTNTNNKVLN